MNRPQESQSFNPRQVQDLKKLISKGESLQLEFKRKAAHPEKIVREMIAFANTRGGTLLVGVGDDLSLPGLKHPEDDAHVIQQELRRCKPPLPISETFVPIGNGRCVILYEIEESQRKPHYYHTENSKQAFIRVNDQSIRASREMREIVRRSRRGRDIQFTYGTHEQFLMKYLDEHGTITLKDFVAHSGLKKFYASRKLILLVLADVLKVTPHEKGDIYSLANS